MYSRLCLDSLYCKYLKRCDRTSEIKGLIKFASTSVKTKDVDSNSKGLELIRKVKSNTASDIYNYVNSKNSLKNNLSVIPSRLLTKRVTSPESIYLIDNDVAGNY